MVGKKLPTSSDDEEELEGVLLPLPAEAAPAVPGEDAELPPPLLTPSCCVAVMASSASATANRSLQRRSAPPPHANNTAEDEEAEAEDKCSESSNRADDYKVESGVRPVDRGASRRLRRIVRVGSTARKHR